MTHSSPLSVELFVATGCSHCPIVLNELSEQLKKGTIASLRITNIAVDNERAAQLNIRSVPWFSIHHDASFMIFSGSHSPKEIRQWIKTSQTGNGMQDYVKDALSNGQLATVIQAIEIEPSSFAAIISMLEDEDTSMEVRIGLDALIESFASSDVLKNNVDAFKNIVRNNDLRLQIDALHYIALAGDPEDSAFINEFTQHEDPQLREAAVEALETLNDLTA
jgi:hypothetical protein